VQDMIFNTDWRFGKKILMLCWEEMTFTNFDKNTKRQLK
jgi:hypothetical protein